MKKLQLQLKRIALRDKYTIGKLYANGVYFCDTLEDKVIDVDKSGKFDGKEVKVWGESAIPYGKYKVVITYSPKFRRYLPILANVLHFVGIRIHAGNYPEDSHGCILVGENKKVGQVLNSRHWEKKVIELIKEYDECEIEII
jgi:hypothetical protein